MREVQPVQASLHGCPKEGSRITCQGIILYSTETYRSNGSSSSSYCHILSFLFLPQEASRLRSRPTSYSDTRIAQVYGKANESLNVLR
jgi:hypothetical protein